MSKPISWFARNFGDMTPTQWVDEAWRRRAAAEYKENLYRLERWRLAMRFYKKLDDMSGIKNDAAGQQQCLGAIQEIMTEDLEACVESHVINTPSEKEIGEWMARNAQVMPEDLQSLLGSP